MKTLRLLLLLLAGSASVASAQNPNFSNTTPAPPSGGANCLWQHDSATPVDLSCYIAANTYDAYGAASAAITAAEAYAVTQATAAQSTAESFATGIVATEHTAMLAAVAASGSGSAHVKYVSTIAGVTSLPYLDCAPGASATGLADSWSALNAYTSAGGNDLEVDGCFALSAALNVASNTTIHATFPGAGFIMLPASNAPVLQNVHLNAPTTASGTGGFLVSNQGDASIRVSGCLLNGNSTQAVTGSNAGSTLHGATPGGKFVYGANFAGVNGLVFDRNEMYDTGAFNFFCTNCSNVWVTNNYLHQPSPTVQGKNTDGIHFTGPDTSLYVFGNTINAGDDSIALNADDGNYPSSGDANSSLIASYVKYGPITEAHVDGTILLNSDYGVRMLSETSLIDDVTVTNTTGNICGIFGSLYPAYPVATGNYGSVIIDGVSVKDSWTCAASTEQFFINSGGSFNPLQVSHLAMSNPSASYPIFEQTAASTGQTLLSDWSVTTKTSTFSSLINTAFSPGQFSLASLNWNDSVGTGSVIAGAYVPATVAVSNYAGPNLLLASGYSPANKNGDAFTNTYTAVVTYISTSFNEGAAGATLAGTAPATCTNGCTGTWGISSGTSFSFLAGGGIQSTVAQLAVPEIINTGQTSEVIRFNISTCSGSSGPCAVALRYTNISNFIALNLTPATGVVTAYDVVGGTATQIGTCTGSTASILGNYTISLNGTHATVAGPYCTTAVMTTANTGTYVGFQNDNTSIYTITSLSASSQ